MQLLSRVVIFLSFLSLPALPSQASDFFDALINEIAWMGTQSSYNDEWIELLNNTDSVIDLSGWVLRADDASPEINLAGSIPTKGFFLLERTDDNSVPGVFADLVYTGSLNNNGEMLGLYDGNGNLIDEADFKDGWPAGSNTTKQTMERKNSKDWQTSLISGGTPKAENSGGIDVPSGNSPKTEISPASSSPQKVYPLGIALNEILPSPEGADADNEWIEVFNQNNFEVDLSGWKISDTLGSVTTYTFPEGSKILGREYQVLSRPTTKITLNNDGDGLKLIRPDGRVIDSVDYDKSPRGRSYNRTVSNEKGGDWIWSINLTPGSENTISDNSESPTEEVKQNLAAKGTDSGGKEGEVKIGLAAVSEQTAKGASSIFLLLAALTLAAFSGIMILFLKKRLLKSK